MNKTQLNQFPPPECPPQSKLRRKKHSQSGCDVEGCTRPYNSKGLCKFHYERMREGIELHAPSKSERSQRLCSVSGCERPHKTKGLCNLHDSRLRTGVPLLAPLQKRAPEGEPMEWFNAHKDSEATECLIWPYSTTHDGYGELHFEGKTRRVHRMMCEHRHGPPPTPKHEAAHSCGNGHLGCFTPSHLDWKTPVENCADRLLHGGDTRGEKSPMSKLTSVQVLEIKSTKGVSQRQLAKKYGVAHSSIGDIKRGETWFWLEPSQEATHV